MKPTHILTTFSTLVLGAACGVAAGPTSAAAIQRGEALVPSAAHQGRSFPSGEAGRPAGGLGQIAHVLLISIDGLHEADLARWIEAEPGSALARIAGRGLHYTRAHAPFPSDSFPGLVAMLTGGAPGTTGVYYDDAYDRELSPPGASCATRGTAVLWDEGIDRDAALLDGGGQLDVAKLPRDPQGCTPVYPHQFLRVNTAFEVVKAAGGRTAWSDKHPSYELVEGPSGAGVDDLFNPEIAAADTSTERGVVAYDELKVQAILEEIRGRDHTGHQTVPVPALFGMNFQAVSVTQKAFGYRDAAATPTPELAAALASVDGALARMVDALEAEGLADSTALVITAKHGQSPIDPARRKIVDRGVFARLVDGLAPGLLAHATLDDVGLLWLSDPAKAEAVAALLDAHREEAEIDQILTGDDLLARVGAAVRDSRTPDVVVLPRGGVIYASPGAKKRAEHGGATADDRHVPLVVAFPGAPGIDVDLPVSTRQVAPTVLSLLGLDPFALEAVAAELTPVLPGAL